MRAFFFHSIPFLTLLLAAACSLNAAPVLATETPRNFIRVVTWTPSAATGIPSVATWTPSVATGVPPVATWTPSVASPAPVRPTVVVLPSITAIAPTTNPTLQSSAINGFSPAELSTNELRLTVGYFYNGEWGKDRIFITAFANAADKGRIDEIVPDTPRVSPGSGQTDIHLRLGTVGAFKSTELTICLYAAGSATPQFLCRSLPFVKSWVIAETGGEGVPPLPATPDIIVPPPPKK